jgi:hypothetical protein
VLQGFAVFPERKLWICLWGFESSLGKTGNSLSCKELQNNRRKNQRYAFFTMRKPMTNGVCGFCRGEGYAPEVLYTQAEGCFLRLFSKSRNGASDERPEYREA